MRLTQRCITNRWMISKIFRKVTFVGCCLTCLVLTLALPGIAQQAMAHKTSAPAEKTKSMNVDGVLAMVQAGLSDDVIIARLRKEDKALALEPDEMIRLKQAKVSDAVLKIMLDPKADLSTPVPAAMPTLQPAVLPGIATTRPSGATIPFKSERIRTGLYKVTVDALQPGEYCFFASSGGATAAGPIAVTTTAGSDIFDFGFRAQ